MRQPFDNLGRAFVAPEGGGTMNPLSYEQEGIWLASRLAASADAFHNVQALRLEGDLDIGRLERALSAVAARHDLLRTVFVSNGDQLFQRVLPESPIRFERRDAPAGATWGSHNLDSYLRQLAQAPFDLGATPPWRATLIRLAARDHVMAIADHHVVFDAASSELLLHDLAAFFNGAGDALPPVQTPYGVYAAQERTRQPQIDRDVDEWCRRMAGTSRGVTLPRRDRSPSPSPSGRSQRRFTIDAALTAGVEQLARQHHGTTFTALVAALAVTLSRVGGDVDVPLQVIRSTRRRPDLQLTLGVMVEAMRLRVDLTAASTFVSLLQQIREELQWGFARPVPQFELARALGESGQGTHGGADVLINFQKASTSAPDFSGLRTSLLRIAGGHSTSAIALEVYSNHGALECLIDYDAARLSPATIERIIEGLDVFLQAALSSPTAPLQALPTVSAAATSARLTEQLAGHSTSAARDTVTTLFADQVRARPDALAVRDGDREWTARSVDEESNRLAHLLRGRGVEPGARVGICLDRSASFVIAALAVMKAGAAYVPLDPAYPAERLRLIAGIATPACVISQGALRELFPAEVAAVLLDRDAAELAAQPITPLESAVTPDSPAYVLFTSGSTGKPRGVIGRHRGIVNRIAWMRRTYPFWSDEVCAQKTSVGFVDSVWEIFGPLTSGVPLLILPDAAVRDARALLGALTLHQVTRIVLVPSLLEAILDASAHASHPLQRLRLCVSSGEPLSPALAARFLATHPHVTLLNIYGSSEVAADATWAEVTGASIRDHVSVGRPIDNVRLYVLDRARQLVPRGEVGEIYVGGAGLAAGYLGDDEATAERFVRDPFAASTDARLFKTGDLGRVRSDGEIEVVGRVDLQVKVRGMRIEPGEIENRLSMHPSVRQSAVVFNRERECLVAFVVPRSPDGIDRSTISGYLRQHLPDFMVPAAIVPIPDLPLSPHGKVDRQLLAVREFDDGRQAAAGQAPSSLLEQQIAELWAEILGVEPRSIDDDFLALGGHSLRATRLTWRIRERLEVELTPGAIFEHSTVRRLAAEVARLAAAPATSLPPILPTQEGETVLPSSAQRQFWIEERLHDGRGANQHGGTYIIRGAFDVAAFDRSLTALLARHDSLRTVTRVEDGELRLQARPAQAHVSPVENLAQVPADEREHRLEIRLSAERRRPLALDAELPIRVRIYRLAADYHALTISVHHSAFDGWSTAILMRELAEVYRAERRGASWSLPPLPIRYADFASWQRQCVDGPAFAVQRAYWRRQFADAPAGLDLPLDRQPRAGAMPRMSRSAVVVGAELAERVRAVGTGEGATLFMTLAAAYATLLARYTGQWDLVIGTAAANRRLPSTQAVIGAFVNPVALRFRLDPAATFSDAVRLSRVVTTDAYNHQDVPFDVVVADVAPQRHATRTPLFESLFVMQDRTGWALELDGATTEEIATPPGATAMPLSLVLREDGATVRGHFEYRADLFDADTVDRMAANFLTLLADAAETPSRPAQQLQVVSPGERERLRGFTGMLHPEPAWERLEQTFARHAEQTPDAPALATRGVTASYASVQQRAQQIAARLIAMGVEPGHVVAIAVPRSAPLYVAMLGALQAGAAYVFVDPQQPAERRRFIIEDAGAVVLIGADTAQASDEALLISPLEPEHISADDTPRSAASLACLVYTSGSSGQPKAVRITHRNIAAMADAWGGELGLSAASHAAQMVSPAFDVALADIFATWLHGGCVCVLDAAESLPGKAMVAAMARFGVTHWSVPPSILAECPVPAWPELEVISVGGEPPSHDVLARWSAVRIVSAYGLTEATVGSTAEDFVLGTPPAAGRPIRNSVATIVDDQGAPVPIGVAGHLIIAGPQVADGYHRRPDLTAERFARTPDGVRLQTFDVARWRADGRIEFLGRRDRQLKFHGYRIEPGEIEAVVRAHPGVEHAFVTVRRSGRDDRLVAYVVARDGATIQADAVRAHARAVLPATMCPTDVVAVRAFPRTATGKIDERALPEPGGPTASVATPPRSMGHTQEIIAAVWREVLGHARFGPDDTFFDVGGHSLLAVRAHDRLTAHFGDALSVVDLFAHPTIAALARHLDGRVSAPRAASTRPPAAGAIAVISMACRYPQSRNVDELWQHLTNGDECLSRLSPTELSAAGVDAAMQSAPGFVPVAGILSDADRFDADFFGLSAAEARLIDPQQRLLLELAQTALDTAGYDSRRYAGRIGVFAGVGFNTYLHEVLYPHGIPSTAAGFAAISANDKDFAASQVAFRLDLRGPAITVQTACSTSLVAVDTAIQALQAGRCDMALAGGVSIRLPQTSGYHYEPGMILSPDGHCRPFDAAAAGTVGSNGGGVVLLKPLDAALADGDQVEAVILGAASNNDGRRKVGFAAPGVEGQVEVIRAAIAHAGIDPGSIHYVEAHGTGTSLGDPIEIQALTTAYREKSDAPLAVGSIKSNIGHTDTAAGVAGLIKAVLSIKHNRIPPSLHFETPNPRIDFGDQVVVANGDQGFPAGVRRAAVSAFGIGGTNAHVILEQAPQIDSAPVTARGPRVLPLSARSEAALRDTCESLAGALGRSEATLDDIAFTLQRGRREHSHRHAIVAGSVADAQAALRQRAQGAGALPIAGNGRSAWLFSGQGSQHPGMARTLYESQPIAREWIDRCASIAQPLLGRDLRELICGDSADIHETRFAQPALFTLQYALAHTWQGFGLTPSAMIGHSIGEFAAACCAGIFSVEDAMMLVCERGRLMQACPEGAMLAIRVSEAEARTLIGADPIDVAAVNTGTSCVVAGDKEAIARFGDRLTAAGHVSRPLATSRAFHSRAMAPAEAAFERIVASVRRQPPAIPIVSTLTGEWMTDDEATEPARWRRQLREPVRFLDAMRSLEQREALALLEIGPDSTVSTLALQIVGDGARCITPSLPSIDDAVARLWTAGATLDWGEVGPRTGRRVALPASAFQRSLLWGEPGPRLRDTTPARAIDEWFSLPAWCRHPLAASQRDVAGEAWLVVNVDGATDQDLIRSLALRGADVRSARPGAGAAAIRAYRPSHVVFISQGGHSDLDAALDQGLHDLLDCVRALGDESRPVALTLVTRDLLDVNGAEPIDPAQAPALGALKIVPYEYPHIQYRHIDLAEGVTPNSLVDELCSRATDLSLALRAGQRWVPTLTPAALPPAPPLFREAGTYIITGGFGGMGLTLARYLGETFRATVALVGRRGPSADPAFVAARAAVEHAGGSILSYAADVADAAAMRAVVDDIRGQAGAIHGCVHAAGVIDHDGVIHRRDRTMMAAAIRAKVYGADILARLLHDQPLDFLVLCSTLGSVFPQAKFGQAGYAAANEYLDAFAGAARRKGIPATTINWDDWKHVGMTEASLANGSRDQRTTVAPAMTPAEGVEVFARIAGSAHPRIIVSVAPIDVIRRLIADQFSGPAPRAAASPADPAAAMGGLWADALGVESVAPDSNFFALGGHSLMAIQVLTRVREIFNVTLPLAGFLDRPTLGHQTEALARALARQAVASVSTAAADSDEDFTL